MRILIGLLLICLVFISILFYKNKVLESQLDSFGRMNNYLGLERDLTIFTAINEQNMTKMKNNLDLNLMFHLTAIEMDGIKNVLHIEKSKHLLCDKHKGIWHTFTTYNKEKYPSTAKELEKLCK